LIPTAYFVAVAVDVSRLPRVGVEDGKDGIGVEDGLTTTVDVGVAKGGMVLVAIGCFVELEIEVGVGETETFVFVEPKRVAASANANVRNKIKAFLNHNCEPIKDDALILCA
jgi:hypothetical protein